MMNERYKAEVKDADGSTIYRYTASRKKGKEFVKAEAGKNTVWLQVIKLCKPCRGIGVVFTGGFTLRRHVCKKCKGGKRKMRVVYKKILDK